LEGTVETVAGGGGRNGLWAYKDAGGIASRLRLRAARTALASQLEGEVAEEAAGEVVLRFPLAGRFATRREKFIGVSFLFCEVYTLEVVVASCFSCPPNT
jgi:hypothetical protein